jgi:DNA primase
MAPMAHTAVEQIKERLSIVDVIGGYVELKHAGKNFKARSPFTNEKTPSFYVSPDRGMYYCFSSQQGGDMFTFIEKMEGVDFKGALKILAERAGVELVAEDPKKRDAREIQYALLEEAAQYFFAQREEHPLITEYIEKRGVKKQTIMAWRIGYARDDWRALRTFLTNKGFSDTEMQNAGLIKKADGGKEPYDVFRDRIMFPLMDASGRVVAFSGRTLKSEAGIPKYVNSPETELFQKSEILYGYDKAKHGIRHYNFSLVVEGQFDLVLAHQAGYTNTVAVSGTALTPHHIRLLMRLSPKVVLALDADRAGISAMKRSAIPMLQAGMDVKVAALPEGKDPADVVRDDPRELKRIVGAGVHVIEFLLSVLRTQTRDERTYKLRVREEILPLIVAIDNRMDREHFEQVVAEHTGATKDGIHHEVTRLEEEKRHTPPAHAETGDVKEIASKQDRRENLGIHLRALMRATRGQYAWIAQGIEDHLRAIRADFAVWDATESPELARELFALEESLEDAKERQLAEDVSYKLTEYAKLTARESLRVRRLELAEAEQDQNESRIEEILAEMKQAERWLQAGIELKR